MADLTDAKEIVIKDNNGNGTYLSKGWLLGILVVLTGSLASYIFSSTVSAITATQNQQAQQIQSLQQEDTTIQIELAQISQSLTDIKSALHINSYSSVDSVQSQATK